MKFHLGDEYVLRLTFIIPMIVHPTKFNLYGLGRFLQQGADTVVFCFEVLRFCEPEAFSVPNPARAAPNRRSPENVECWCILSDR